MAVNILIVDDSAVMRKILESSLRQAQISIGAVIEAADGAEALQKLFGSEGVNIVFSDLNLPNMDGLELLRNIRQSEKFKALPVIMVTTEGTESKVTEVLSLGASGYIRKPFTPLEIQKAVFKLIS